jgi:hypothetical protein
MPHKRLAFALTLPLATAGCAASVSGPEPESDILELAQYEPQLTERYNESVRIEAELDAAETQIVQGCLEEQGFTDHDPMKFWTEPVEERETFMDKAPHDWFLPSAADAERRGFWQWTALGAQESIEGSAELLAEWEGFKAGTGGVLMVFTPEDQAEYPFYSLPDEEKYAWYVAYGGEVWAERLHGDLVGVEPEESDGFGSDIGGCKLEMLEAVYGPFEDGEDPAVARPMDPPGDLTAMNERYAEETAPVEDDLLDCLADRGRDGWEFSESRLLVHEYLSAAGEGDYAADPSAEAGGNLPEPPTDAPAAGDAQGWFDFERAMALDFAQCGDESGYREAAEHGWAQAQLRYHLDMEDVVTTWQEEMRGYLAAAQEVLEG